MSCPWVRSWNCQEGVQGFVQHQIKPGGAAVCLQLVEDIGNTWRLGLIQHLLTTLPFGEYPSTWKWHQLELFQVIFINMPTNLYLPSHMLTWVWNNLGSDCSVWLLIRWSFHWHCWSPSEAAVRSRPGSPGHFLKNENISVGSSWSLML